MTEIKVVRGDITQLAVDAIVNAAAPELLGGGGVDGAIHAAAGPELLVATRQFHGCPRGEARVTPGFKLPARYVVHTPGPIWRGGKQGEAAVLRRCYLNSLRLAAGIGCRTVAFSSISTGVYGYPLAEAAKVAVAAIREFVATDPSLTEVLIVAFDERTAAAYQAALAQ